MTSPKKRHTPTVPSTAAKVDDKALLASSLGSGLLSQQPTPSADQAVTVAKVCPQCASEYTTTDKFCPKDGTPLRPKGGGDPLIGRVIADRYLVLARLGEGGMGRVYLAEHVKMTRQCAIKVMNPSLVTDQESLQRFAREASSAARILHPNVAAVFDYGEADKIVYLVMEYVDGEPLSSILAREGALDPRRAIEIARQVADGLHAAHELGIVHRDLKPDNVIVARNKAGKDIPKVVDFGIAKAMSEQPQDALTRSGLVIGTPEYMSPEQLLGDPVDARSDIYSLGCILYQMLTGAQPFAAESREQMIRRRLHEAPPHVRDQLPDLPRRLDTLIVHMLARSPNDRLASATEARDSLDPALALSGWDPRSVSAPVAASNHSDPSLQPTVQLPKVRTSPTRIAIGAAAGSVLLLGGMAVWKAQSTPAPAPRAVAPQVTRPDSASFAAPAVVSADSAAKLAKLAKDPVVVAKPKASDAPDFDAPLIRLRDAIRSKDTRAVGREFPGLSGQMETYFKDVFARAGQGRVNVSLVKEKPVIKDNHAERAFRLDLSYTDPKTMMVTHAPLHFRASYQMAKDGQWVLSGLAQQ